MLISRGIICFIETRSSYILNKYYKTVKMINVKPCYQREFSQEIIIITIIIIIMIIIMIIIIICRFFFSALLTPYCLCFLYFFFLFSRFDSILSDLFFSFLSNYCFDSFTYLVIELFFQGKPWIDPVLWDPAS